MPQKSKTIGDRNAQNTQKSKTIGDSNDQMPQKSKTIGDRNAKKGIGFGKNGYLMYFSQTKRLITT
jgi:hypothetical protein